MTRVFVRESVSRAPSMTKGSYPSTSIFIRDQAVALFPNDFRQIVELLDGDLDCRFHIQVYDRVAATIGWFIESHIADPSLAPTAQAWISTLVR